MPPWSLGSVCAGGLKLPITVVEAIAASSTGSSLK
jgi:hypothetical protein